MRRSAARAVCAAWLVAAALLAGTPARADFAEGFAAFQAEDYEAAWTLLEPVAEVGDKRAQFLLGEMLLKGLGREPDEFAAAGWFHKAVAEPDPDRYALYALASQYFNGDGVPQDVANAINLYERAASLGDVNAMRSLAAIYARGEGDTVSQDLNRALRWLYAAAETGDAASADRFARLARASADTPPFSGRWVALSYAAPADHPSWTAAPEFLPDLVGRPLTLARNSFAMPGTTCNRPVFITGESTPAELIGSLAGAMPYGLLGPLGDAPLPMLMVVCDGALAATMAGLPDGKLLVSALGGMLLFDVSPSPIVETAQRLLTEAGYDPGPVDGLFGPRTGGALRDFQAAAGLLPTGAFDDATMFALAQAAARVALPPDPAPDPADATPDGG